MKQEFKDKSSITFTVNNHEFKVSQVDATTMLSEWLRGNSLTGTKVMCNEGGCGACAVAMTTQESSNPKTINSCLMPLYAVDGCSIVTSDGIGSLKHGYDNIHKKLAEHGATQCGYCTPGFAMAMYSKLKSGEKISEDELVGELDGNICRCTGYRSIIDAAKSLAATDIEDLANIACIKNNKSKINFNKKMRRNHTINKTPSCKIYQPTDLDQLKSFMSDSQVFTDSSMIVCAHTSKGVYKTKSNHSALLDVSKVKEMNQISTETSEDGGKYLSVGASVTINQLIDELSNNELTKCSNMFSTSCKHLAMVAGNPIRNVASWAGNVMLKYHNRDFPSDVTTVLESLKATMVVWDSEAGIVEKFGCIFARKNCEDLMSTNMSKKVLISMEIPIPNEECNIVYKTYKIMPRSQNSHAYINAAFRAKVVQTGDDKIKFDNDVDLVFGNINPEFGHASETEQFLKGKELNNETLTAALKVLSSELKPQQYNAADLNAASKTDISLSLFYKFMINCVGEDQISDELKSARKDITKQLTCGKQTYTTDVNNYPVSQPIPKTTSLTQASGEAYFQSDLPPMTNEVHCAFVLSQVANCDIDNIDYTFAEKQPGFVHIVTGSNFPCEVRNLRFGEFDSTQQLIATNHIDYAGQPVALVIAESEREAREIASLVEVSYKNKQQVLTNIRDAISNKSFYPLHLKDIVKGDVDTALENSQYTLEGSIDYGSQYHYFLETQICRCEPNDEGGFVIESATQTHQWLHQCVSEVYGVPNNKIEIKTKRIGGAFGGKATNSIPIGLAAVLGSHVTGRPCRLNADMKTCMSALGSRTPWSVDYKIGFNSEGILQAVDYTVYTNSGCSVFDCEADVDDLVKCYMDSSYHCANRRVKRFACKTNLPSYSWFRAPGPLQLTAFADQMNEVIADHLSLDPIDVKFRNLYSAGQDTFAGPQISDGTLRDMFSYFMEKVNVKERQNEIKTFNSKNKFIKRGIAVSSMKYPFTYSWFSKYNVVVTISGWDGSVVVSHGGIESGQGLDTKVCQVVARQLGCQVGDVTIQRTSTITSTNSEGTAASTTSEIVCMGAMKCCDIILERIKTVLGEIPQKSWKETAKLANDKNVDLIASYTVPPTHANDYNVWGVSVAEAELDILTGQHKIKRVDILQDTGVSMNPVIDLGQVEGGFVMATGFWLSEQLNYDVTTGKLITDGSWWYKPPTTKDIPEQLNVEFLSSGKNPVGTHNRFAVVSANRVYP